MAQWYCFKDKVPMEEGELVIDYLEMTNAVEGIRCPKCGKAYFLEKTVVEKVNKAEQMLENK